VVTFGLESVSMYLRVEFAVPFLLGRLLFVIFPNLPLHACIQHEVYSYRAMNIRPFAGSARMALRGVGILLHRGNLEKRQQGNWIFI
jgi:hypothetical protein